MRTRALIASAVLAAFLPGFLPGFLALPAAADTMTAKVKVWDPAKMMLQMQSKEVFLIDPAKIEMPAGLQSGDTVTIDYTSNDNGLIDIYSVKKKS